MTHPPAGPSTPPPPSGPKAPADDAVETIADLLRVIALIAADQLTDRDPAGRMRLAQGLRTARLALDDLRLPGASFELPMWPGTAQLAASFARRAD